MLNYIYIFLDTKGEYIMNKKNSEMDVKVGHMEIKMQNTPKWAFILVSIGVAVFLILAGASLLKQNIRFEKIMQIKESIITGKKLTTEQKQFIKHLTTEEKKDILGVENERRQLYGNARRGK